MSHSTGLVKFPDGAVMFYEYNGTVDIVCPALYEECDDMAANWRDQPYRECTCGRDEEVIIYTHYGGGSYWQGRACRYCRAVIEGIDTVEEYIGEIEGTPFWAAFHLRILE